MKKAQNCSISNRAKWGSWQVVSMLHYMKSQKHQLLLPNVLDHQLSSFWTKLCDQCGIRSAGKFWGANKQILWNDWQNFDAPHSDGEKSQILSILTAYIDYVPNLSTTLWGRVGLFLSWLVRQHEFKNSCLFFCCLKESSPEPKIQQIICLLLCVLFNYSNSR